MSKEFKFTMGADPEFNICILNKRVTANEEIRKACDGKLTSTNMGYLVPKAGNMGWDGCASTGEIRPDHSNNPYKVAENIKNLITALYQKLPMMDLITTNNQAPVGGHIHFTIPNMTPNNQNSTKINNMIKKLDLLFLPILAGENKDSELIRRKNGHYGALGDHKTDSVRVLGKDIIKIEYRTPNAEWIQNPKICQATLAYMGVCWHEILEHPNNFNKIKEIAINNDETREAILSLFLGAYNFAIQPIITKIKTFVRTFERYEDFKDDIEYLFDSNKVIKDKEKNAYNAITGWNLRINTKLTRLIVKNCNTMTKKLLKDNNINSIPVGKLISYNDDLNCHTFASNLAVLLAYGHLELKNKYSIFGLRKGIKEPIIYQFNEGFISGLDQAKTNADLNKIDELFGRMQQNLQYESILLNNQKSPYIIIGLPYEMRAENKFRDFMNIIYKIEKQNQLKTTTIDEFRKSQKTNSTQKDEINNIYQNKEEISFDTNSQGLSYSRDAIHQINQERINQQEEERQEEERQEEAIPPFISPEIMYPSHS